jgi:dTDP-4-dehydrorhamnose reductase
VRLLVVGAESLVGHALSRLLTAEQVEFRELASVAPAAASKAGLLGAFTLHTPSVVLNVADANGPVLADQNAEAAQACDEYHAVLPAHLAEACNSLGIPLLQHSSALVFDGLKAHPYTEDDAVNPIGHYGKSKWQGECAIRQQTARFVILRTDWVFSASHPEYFTKLVAACGEKQGRLPLMNLRFSPTPAADVARVLLAIARQIDCGAEPWGTYHYCAQPPLTQDAFAEHVLQEAAKLDPALATCLAGFQIERQPVLPPFVPNSVLNGQKLFETFGIKPRSRGQDVADLVAVLYGKTARQRLPVSGGAQQ